MITVQWTGHGRVKLLESWPKATQLFSIVLLNILIRVTFFSLVQDLNSAPFAAVFSISDPTKALSAWYEAFLPVVEKHAPLWKKRVKHPTRL